MARLGISERRGRVRPVACQICDGAQKTIVLVLPVLVHGRQLTGFLAGLS